MPLDGDFSQLSGANETIGISHLFSDAPDNRRASSFMAFEAIPVSTARDELTISLTK
jgi:hypothetical protein